MKRIQLLIPEDLYESASNNAWKSHLTLSEWIRMSMKASLEVREYMDDFVESIRNLHSNYGAEDDPS